jgi:hypothetical protein
MKYGVDLISVEAGNQPTRVLCGKGGKVDPRPRASSRASGMIGSEPWVPVPMISRPPPRGAPRQRTEELCPSASRYGFDGFHLRFRHPATLDDDVVLVLPPLTSMDPNRRNRTCIFVTSRWVTGPRAGRRPPLPIVHNPRHNPVLLTTRVVCR